MTQDEIIRSPLGRDQIIDLAREASPDMTWYAATEDPTQVATEELEFLERFAALVSEPWIETNKALVKEIIELKKQAEQEPCGHVLPDGTICWDRWCPDAGTLLYTHPVRTKDLTDDEIWSDGSTIGLSKDGILKFARAVISADREKNK